VIADWEAYPRHSDPVFARDGWRCQVPACSSRRELQDHHITFRSRGGSHARSNRTAICAAHHHHGIHAGVIRA
jgi:5-methylcytosine-specific restriction endonuclease McrA